MSHQPDYLLGIHNFKGRTEDELDILRGDYIEVIEDDSAFKDSWYIGRNLNTNATGLFPKAFTTAVAGLPAEVQQRIDSQDAAAGIAAAPQPQSQPLSQPQPQPQPPSQPPSQPQSQPQLQSQAAAPSPTPSSLAQQQFYAPQQPLAVDTQIGAPAHSFTERAAAPPPPAQGLAQMALNGQADAPSRSLSPASSGSHAPPSGVSSRGSAGSASNSRIPSDASGGGSYRHVSQSSLQPPSDIDAAISEMSGDPALMPPPTVLSWTPQNVEAYFMAKGFVEDAPKFVQHRITGPILLELDRETLKEIDIVSFGPRFAIDKELRFLRQVIGVAQSPVQDSPRSPLSAMGSQTFSPIAQTPQMGAQGFFPYGNGSYSSFGPQPGASVTTLSAQVQPNVQPSTAHAAQGGADDVRAMQYPQAQQPQAQQPQAQPSPPLAQQQFASSSQPQYSQPNYGRQQQQQHEHQRGHQQYGQPQYGQPQNGQPQYGQPQYGHSQHGESQYGQSQYGQQQYAQQPHSTERRPSRPQQQYAGDARAPQSEALPIPGALGSHSQSGSEEEITGSLGSNFSARPPASAAALAAAQAASQGTRGHHRHTSSATSRYSVVPSQGHARKRTLDDWESGLEPAVLERAGPSGATHARNASNVSNKSSLRGSMPSVPSVPVEATTPSTVSSAAFEAKARKHNRSASESARSTRSAMSTDSKKHSRRASVLSLLPGSPKTPKSPKKEKASGDANGAASGKISSPKRSADSGAGANGSTNGTNNANGKRASSENTFKSLMRPNLTKQKTSAFQEGIKSVTAEQASATASKSGWMHKRGGSGLGVWVKRFFTLHGTRLSYFASFKDEKERGLIDITGHRVLPVKDHELLVSLSAAGMGAGRFCFKLVPPGPGYKKGVAFTAPKVHYFAVESEKEMREWQSALMSATIERDESQPVLSTSQTPTISLPKAQELMAARLAEKGDIGSLSGFAT